MNNIFAPLYHLNHRRNTMRSIITKAIALLALLNIAVFAQQKGTFTDPRDNKKYNTVKIGKQIWLAENLNYSGSDGYLGLCYDKDPENCQKYGRLYDWSEAMGIDRAFNKKIYVSKNAKQQGVCPAGWHLPNDKEWQALIDFVGGDKVAGKKLKAKEGWKAFDFSRKNFDDPKCKWTEEKEDDRGRIIKTEYDKCSTDEFGFSALPGGQGSSPFYNVSKRGVWWSASQLISDNAYYKHIDYDSEYFFYNPTEPKSCLYSVRCVMD